MDGKGDRHILLHPGGQALAMRPDVLPQLVHGPRDQRCGKDRQPQAPSDGVGLGAVGGDAQWGVGLLHRPGKHREVPHAKVLPLIRQPLARPGLADDLQGLHKSFPSFFGGDIIRREHTRGRASAHSQLQAAAAEDVHRGGLLGDFQRVVQGQERDGRAQANALGALGRRRQHGQRGGEPGDIGEKVDLGQPRGIKAQIVPELDLREDVVVALNLGLPFRTR